LVLPFQFKEDFRLFGRFRLSLEATHRAQLQPATDGLLDGPIDVSPEAALQPSGPDCRSSPAEIRLDRGRPRQWQHAVTMLPASSPRASCTRRSRFRVGRFCAARLQPSAPGGTLLVVGHSGAPHWPRSRTAAAARIHSSNSDARRCVRHPLFADSALDPQGWRCPGVERPRRTGRCGPRVGTAHDDRRQRAH
jgi:hypothetical protein